MQNNTMASSAATTMHAAGSLPDEHGMAGVLGMLDPRNDSYYNDTHGIVSNGTRDWELDILYSINNGSIPQFPGPDYYDQMHSMHGMPPDLMQMEYARHTMQLYVTPCLVAFGILGNFYSCVILELSSAHDSSCTHYLVAKMVADTIFLINLLCSWLAGVGVDLYRMSTWCHFSSFISQSSNFLSLWYLVAYAVDGLMRVAFSHRAPSLCQSSRAKIIILILAVVAVPIFLNISLTVEVVHMGPVTVCAPMTVFLHAVRHLGQLDMFINCILPYTSLVLLAIWCAFYRIYRIIFRGGTPTPQLPTTHGRQAPLVDPRDPHGQAMFFLVVTSHLLLKLPIQMIRIYLTMKAMMGSTQRPSPRVYLWQQLMDHPNNTSFAITFLLLLFSKVFRISSCKTFKICCSHVKTVFHYQTEGVSVNTIEEVEVLPTDSDRLNTEAC